MTPIDNPALQNLHQRTRAMLTAIDDAPLEHRPRPLPALLRRAQAPGRGMDHCHQRQTFSPAETDLGHHPAWGRGGLVHNRHRDGPDRWDP